MRFSIWRDLAILLAIFGLIWLFFSYNSFWIEEGDLRMSYEQEEDLSDFLNDNTLQEYEKETDSTIIAAIDLIAERLIKELDSSQYEYKITVLRSNVKNAFTTLNGNIYIFSGLIEYVESAEELALILCHEIGHVENRHVVDKITRQIGLEALFAIITGGDPVLISEISKLAISTSFDRKKEVEADDYAYDLAVKCNLNPRRLAQFFIRTLNEESVIDLKILNTHPHSKRRVQSASEYALPEGFEELAFDMDWEVVQQAL